MPTANPRVNVTLSPSLDSLVSRLAQVERVSKSMVLRELLESAEPALLRAVTAMEAAKGASAEARRMVAKDMQTAVDAALIYEAGILELATKMSQRDLVADAESIKGRRPARLRRQGGPAQRGVPGAVALQERGGKALSKRKDPPVSNRGVKS